MTYTFIARACTDLPVSACCRVMRVSTSGFYAWQANPLSERDLDDAYLTNTIVDIHKMSRRSYGSPRVHAELRLGEGISCSKKRVAESFFGTLQLELFHEHHWDSRQQLALAVFEWIEAWYNPKRRHSYCKMLSPIDYEAAHAA